jgi:YVTN family beta-propeller protein
MERQAHGRLAILASAALLTIALGCAPARAQSAYITNGNASTVAVIATATNTLVGSPIMVGTGPLGVAVTPDGSKVYVTNDDTNTVSVIATATNTVIGSPITVGTDPFGAAVTPDGSKIYVANSLSGTVSVIATATNTVIGSPIAVGTQPFGVATTPDGSKVYVANAGSNTVSVIATATNTVIGSPIAVGRNPVGLAVTPDGSKVYVANEASVSVSVIATATDSVVGTLIAGGNGPQGVAVVPDGSKVYITNTISGTVSVIATATNTVIGSPIPVGGDPYGVAVTPDGSKVYVANFLSNTVSVIATASNTVLGSPIAVGSGPFALGNFIGPPTLTVARAGSGAGQVTSSPAGINCSASSNQCATMFPNGTQVTLTASAAAGSTFSGWSGGGCSGTGPCVITPTADTTVTATFALIPSFMLSVAPAGMGSGTVTSNPSGINCGATCSASFQQGTQVTLSAAAATGSTFAGWSGSGCSGNQTCSVTVSAATSVTATFVQNSATNITLAASVLPESRSVQVGTAATAFVTIIDAGPGNATTCLIAPSVGVPATFLFQTTDPSTNALTGIANTPVNIPQGTAQSFVIALTPTAPFNPADVAFTFGCADASPASTLIGVNTLNLSASATPVPDIVALAASGDPGFVDIPGATGIGVFAVATVNLGIDATITASADSGTANLPVTLTVCQTDPASGNCLAVPSSTVTTDIAANATPTFGIFVAGSHAVTNSPGTNRVFVRFRDTSSTLRGATSVAVRSQ